MEKTKPPPLFYELELDELAAWLKARKQPGYRTRQIFAWAYQHSAAAFADMTDLPADLREQLAAAYRFGPLPSRAVSENDETTKLLLELADGQTVECVRIAMDGSYTACVSSQVGCAVKCAFCATGQFKLQRSLTAGEIIQQVVTINTLGARVRNVVFMGMGEPFHNYANVVKAVRRLIQPDAFGMSPRRITISTSGIVPAIHRYAEEGLATELAVSLNASTDEQRRELMPGTARYTLPQLLEACRHFSEAHGGQPVTFAYVLMENVNDSFDDAERLGKLLKGLPHHLNVIPFNEVAHARFKAPVYPRVRAFMQACQRHGLNISLRHSKGGDIDAACGQLRARDAGA
ncbi:MAG: 23S rRNA (adenine(2503)-C(2))-methyltransferase RlmN [Armatimonadetes bacterium]|nr:23S rRNA (adenine(2503)-C(2))-methyltransferase RlmN [Armatimonadota bacterium]